MSTKQMQRARVNRAELEFEVTGAGEPVLLIHGAFIAEAYAPLCAEPAPPTSSCAPTATGSPTWPASSLPAAV